MFSVPDINNDKEKNLYMFSPTQYFVLTFKQQLIKSEDAEPADTKEQAQFSSAFF